MNLWFLGTAAAEGWPALFCDCLNCEKARKLRGKNIRTRAQALIDHTLLLDFGPDTFYHTIEQDVPLSKIETLLLTHSHTDHFYSTELILRALPYAYNRDRNPLQIYGNEKCAKMFQYTLDSEDDSINLLDCVQLHVIHAFKPFTVKGYDILPLEANHDPSENCLIYLITSHTDGKTLLYANDTGYFPDTTWLALEGKRIDIVSLDCTMGGYVGETGGHMNLEWNQKVKERLEEMGCLHSQSVCIATHFSHNGGLTHDELEAATAEFGCIPAFDGMQIEV